jgi:hypothetical protein
MVIRNLSSRARTLLSAAAVCAVALTTLGSPASADHVNRVHRPPTKPTNLRTDPPLPPPCRWCDGKPFVAHDKIRLLATISDPDNGYIEALWQIHTNGVVESRTGPILPSGATHDTVVDLRGRDGKVVGWWVHGFDGLLTGEAGVGPGPFVVDRTGVAVAPTVTSMDSPPGTFTFGANGVGDIDHYLYGWEEPPTTKVDADALGGNASVTSAPPGAGPRNLYVVSVDRAGHRSPTRVHQVRAAPTTR